MGAKIPPDKRRAVAKDLADGWTMKEVARRNGVSDRWVKSFNAGIKHDNGRSYSERGQLHDLPGPIALDNLSPEALKATTDIAYFARRYFGLLLMPWQEEATEKIVELQSTDDEEYVVINVAPGTGKALALDTPIPTPDGWSTMKELQPGDRVFGDDGKPCRVVAKSEVFYGHDCYEVRTDDGSSVIADAEHLWPVRIGGEGQYTYTGRPDAPGKTGPKTRGVNGVRTQTTEFLARRRAKRPQLAIAAPLDLPDRDLPIPPYVLGVWLGDGDSRGPRISSHCDDAPFVRAEIEACGFTTHDAGPTSFRVSGTKKWARDGLKTLLRLNNLLENKHIPEVYFRASADQRLALLQGLVDTDGYVDGRGRIEFTSTNRRLAEGARQLAHSLGVKASLTEGRATIAGRDCGPKYRVGFYLANAARLPRKAERCRNGVRTPHRYLTTTKVESVPTQCIAVDSPSRCFLAGAGMLVTHNSTFFTLVLPSWITIRQRHIRGMIGSASWTLAKQYVGELRTVLSNPIPLRNSPEKLKAGIAVDAEASLVQDYGIFKPDEGKWAADAFFVTQHDEALYRAKEPTWQAFGRGTTFIGSRVDFCIWDDVYDPEQMRSVEAREQLKRWWKDIAETRLEPGGLMVLQGQRMDPDDIYHFALEQKRIEVDGDGEISDGGPKYQHIVYKAHYDDRCKGKDGHKRTSAPYPEGCLLFPRRLPWTKLASEAENNPENFALVYQQEDVAPGSTLVDPLWVKGGTGTDGVEYPGCWDNDRGLCELPAGFMGPWISVVTADPSPTRFWAVEWWVVHLETQMRYLMDLHRSVMEAPDFLDYIIETRSYTGLMEEWRARAKKLGYPIDYFIFEKNAAQRFMTQVSTVQNWLRIHNISLISHETHRNKSDPNLGVPAIGPHYQYGRVRLPGKIHDPGRVAATKLVSEATRYRLDGRNSGTTDCVMAHWFLEWNLPNLAPKETALPKRWTPSWFRGAA